jgi:hypothetical protein
MDLLKSTSSIHNSTPILHTKENPKPNRLPKYMIKPLHILHPPFWLILGGSLCEDLGFFHSFKTSPRSSKSESGCKSCACFSFRAAAVWFGRIIRVLSQIIRALPGSSGFQPGSSGLFVKFIPVTYSASRIIRLPTRIIRALPGSSGYVPGHPGFRFTTLYIDLPRHPDIARIIRVCVQIIRAGQQLRETASFLGVLYIPLYQSGRGLTTSF